jgi:hypothetical protein
MTNCDLSEFQKLAMLAGVNSEGVVMPETARRWLVVTGCFMGVLSSWPSLSCMSQCVGVRYPDWCAVGEGD